MMYLFWAVAGYLSGCVLYGYLLPKWFCRVDVTKQSPDGNPGAANALLYGGKAVGALVILLELLKAFLPVYLAARVLDVTDFRFGLVIAAPVAGHAFPFWRKGKGGKSIAASFGALLGLFPNLGPVLVLAFFYLLFSLVLVIRPHFFRSVLVYALLNISSFILEKNPAFLLGMVLISLIVIGKHFVRYHGEKFALLLFGKRLLLGTKEQA
ncbi:glycerol-3-phosphate acyltransferase [Cuneatibacter sp. NSJ-177]|uniref:glycerol-3-phosphate acyltransferase n=1 Tax=Cuneatibacter sp. NSJ-177 TaxID=2931401 RepID=UPI001FD3DBD8|nr:glycerol-3-phosphate acyltransferase [Cuneatibacter sp. NSJ-177]MCJ7836116.1 glycerol-3-phosphate acyltransferase [Cuneatibacter sp. NSJ-177]